MVCLAGRATGLQRRRAPARRTREAAIRLPADGVAAVGSI